MEIEVGQWYRNGAGHIVFCLAKNPYTTDYPWVMISHNGYDTEVESYQIDGTYSSSPYLEGIEDIEDWNIVEHLPDCTGFDWVPKPVYRPFANAAEFAPHRDRWLLSGSERLKVIWYSDVSLCSTKFWCWKEAFHKFTFEDGTPFGVRVS